MYDQTAGAPEPDDFDLMDDAALDALLEQRLNDRAGAAQERADTLRPVDDDLPAPLSFGQERLWFLDRYESGGIEYNSAVGLHLRGELDTAALTTALGRLVERHEPLRTTFAVVDGRPRQVVRPAAPVDLDVRDLTDLPEPDRSARADELLRAELGRPFDLVEGPLLRAVLLRLGAAEHTLLVNMHHIAADGWSKGVFARELGVFYANAAEGRDGGLPPLPTRYRDYAAWQREQLTDDRLESELTYWKGVLADVEPLELPTDRPRPAVRTTNGALARFRVPAEVGRALSDLGQRHDGTLFSVLVAATQVLLARYSRQRDIAVGTVSMGRERSELEPLVGFFVNTLVLRSEVDADLPFTEFLGRVTDTVWDALAHQDLPFDRLVDALRIERDPSRTPLVQAAVVLQNTPAGEVALPGLEVTEFRPPSVSSIFDLTLEFAETASGELTGTVEYNTDLFDAGTMARFTGHLGELLAGIAADPTRPVGDLPLLTAEEEHLLGREWGDNRSPYPADATVHGLVADRARRGPDAVAVDGPAGRLSYRELEERANRLARHLVARGAEPGGYVAVCLPRGADFYVALLAVLKAGCAYVPLDPDHPAERLAHILDDTRAPLCLTDRDLAGRLPAGRTRAVLLDEEAEAIAALPQDDPAVAVGPGDAAYVLYTSGSTGTPKGVVVEHRSIVRLVSGNDYAPLHPDDVVAQAADVAFDAATFEIWGALTAGARIVPVDRETLLDARALTAAIERLGITTMWLTAGLFDQVAAVDPAAFGRLRNLLFGGDAVNPRRVAQVLAAAPPQRLVNGYGPTETTTFATWHHVVEGDGTTPVPIGRPIANTSVHVLDERRSRVPVGVPGELYIGGPGVARGYLNLPELTEERFCADPYSESPEARLYRTGDLVRWRSDGTLEFLGRTDHQVKVRGYRIEPGEIESVLEQHPAVSAAVVTVRQDGGRKQLVGYVRQSADGQVDPAGLRAFAESRLPGYLVPSALVVLAEFPLTASGKLDRRALPAPTEQHTPGADFTAPVGEAEQALARVWAEVLGIERVGTRDNFFDLGGDSILSIQVVAKARQVGWELTSKDVFARQTVAELARAAVPVTAAVDTEPVTGEAPLTPVQRWFFAHHTRALHHFNQSVLLTLAPGTDEQALAEALRAVVAHHDALRMRFPDRGAALRQVNLPVGEGIALERVDLGHLAAGERRDAEVALAEQAQAGLDIEDGPLLRAVLFTGAPDEPSRLFLTVHHLVVDGVSWRILLEDLERAVSQAAAGRPVDLGAKTTSFLDWARRLAEHVAAGGFDAEADHWRKVAALPAAALPVDHDGENTMAAVREVRAALDAEATDALLRRVPAVYRTQVNDILLAALGRTLCRWTGEEQVVVDLEGHGREEILDGVDVSRTTGWFTSIFPVLLTAPHGAGAGDLIKSVKEGLRAVPQRGIGYGGLRHLADGPSALPECAPAVSFNYLGQWQDVADHGLYTAVEFDFGRDHSPLEVRPHLLDIVGEVRGGRLEFTLHYASDVHDEATVRALADGLVDAVRALIGHCLRPGVGGATPSDFPLAGLDQATVDRLVGSGDGVEDVYPLTPMQSGMLFHALTEPDGAYLDHVSFLLEGAGDTGALGTAWQRVVEATPALRTQLVWEGVDRPLQVVRSDLRADIRTLDWRGHDAAERARLLAELTAQERRDGLDLAAGPLSRVVLAREADDATRVVWTFHHVVLDGWSISRILGDLFAHYRALVDGTAVPEGAVRARPPFRDYVQWLAGQDAAAAEAHWRRVLAGLTSPTPLPYDRRPAPGHQSEAADRIRVELAPEDCAALSQRARGHRLTLNTMVQGAWALLLSRYSGEEDVCFGSTVAGRPADLPGVADMVGNFLNTIPVRTRVAKGQDVLAWLRQLQDEQVEARGYEYLPLTRVQSASELPRGTRLFDSIVVFENYPGNGRAAAEHGLAVTGVTAVDTTSYPLDLTAYLDGDRLALQLAYDAALFDGDRVARMAEHLAELLRGMAHGADRTVAELPMLPDRERELLLGELSGSTLPFDRDSCLHELIARQARRVPDNDAVVFGGASLSYAELDEMADRLAQELAARGVGAGSVVAICVERGLHMVVALLGVLKAGGAYLPLDPAHPADRLEYVLADSAAALVITQSAVAGRIPGEVPLLRLDEEWSRIARLPALTPDSGVTPGHPAYLIYTSGSTGRPKGVLVEHRSVAFAAESWKRVYRTGEEPPARQLNVASMSFDVFVSDLAHVLCHGGALVIAPAEATTEPGQLLDLMHSARVTHLETVPSLANALVEEAERRGTGLPPLRFLAVGSDNWRTQDCRRLLAQTAEGTVVLNSYGVTEATVESCAYVVHADRLPDGPGVPVGRAIPGVRTYVLDEAGRPVPAGVVGELYLGGPGVARGYLNRPELTEERFLPDPFSTEPGARLYRTGDMVRRRADGDIEFAGRADDQVKIRGFRIELAEVEAALRRHPAVADAVVAARTDDGTPARLVGYVVTAAGHPFPAAELRAHLEGVLPRYMVPAVLVELAALPLNSNGKVDRRALPAPAPEAARGSGHVAPRNPVEEALAEVWAQVLRVDRVGVEDNFFDLGGDSILSIQVVTRARQKGITLSSKDLFAHQTVAELAFATTAADPAGKTVETRRTEPVVGRVPLTPIQRTFFDRHRAAPHHSTMSVLVTLSGAPDTAALRRALDALLDHHDQLRARYTSAYGRWQQEVTAPGAGWPLEEVDLAGHDAPEEEMHRAATRAQAGFDLAAGRPVAAVLFHPGEGRDHQLFLTAHHLVVDAVSWQVLLTDLETAYAQAAAGRTVDLGERTTSFRDWALRLSEHTAAGGFDGELDHWVATGRRAEAALPVDRPGEATIASAAEVRVTVGEEDTRALLHDVPATYRTQVNDVLLTALGTALADWTGRASVLFDLEGHGREDLFDDVDTSRTAGWFTSAFPVALTPSGADWGERLKQVKEQLRAVPGRGIGYGALRHLSPAGSPAEILAEAPSAQVCFNYLGQEDEPTADGGLVRGARLGFGTEQAPEETLEYLLDVVAQVRAGRLEISLYHSSAVHDTATVERFGERLVAALRGIVAHCAEAGTGGATPSDFPLAKVDQTTLDQLTEHGGRIDDLYPLTPMQGGLLFHSLSEPGEGIYLGHLSFVLDGVDDLNALAEAWQLLTDRNAILRTAAVWENVDDPLQVVYHDVRMPVQVLDWTGLTEAERAESFELLLDEERARPMDLTVAPLSRVVLIAETERSVRTLWTSHHVLLDGWSSADLLAELLEHYLRVRGLKDGPLPARRPFRDYVAWLDRQDPRAAERHWRGVLEGHTDPTPLPVDHDLPGTEWTGSRARVSFQFEQETSDLLAELVKRHRLTVNTLAQGAWALLLSRYSGRTDVCFGSAVSGRPADLPGVETIAGIFINNIPVRTRVAPESRLLDWLAGLQREQTEARSHEFVSLSQIRGWAQVPAGTSLYDSYIVVENYPYEGEMGAEYGVSLRDPQAMEFTNFPMVLAVFPAGRLAFRLAYDPVLFEPETAERVLNDLRAVLEEIAHDPERTLGRLGELSAEHRQEAITAHQGPRIAFDDRPVHLQFAEQAQRTPQAVAVADRGGRLTFAELDAAANRLAHHLAERGVGAQSPVAVLLDRGTDLVTALLAVLKAGGTYCPVDPAAPAERLALLLEDTAAPVVVTHGSLRERLPQDGAAVVDLDEERAAIAARPDTAPPSAVSPDDAAYVIHTSGSTGRPKGVVVEHRSLANLLDSHRRTVFGPVRETAQGRPVRVAHLAPASFDASWNPVLWLVDGNELHIVDDTTRRDAQALADYVVEHRVEFLQTTPSYAQQLFDTGLLERSGLHLRGLALGGEQVGQALWNLLRARPELVSFNFYGPTECTVDALITRLADSTRPVLGRPVQNTRAYVLDEELKLLPVGAPGELCLAGAGLAREYLGRPELTGRAFVRAPFGSGERLYRTGDRVRRLPDGTLEYLGRLDHQIKLRGYRIEPGEIEYALAGHPGVEEAVVTVLGEGESRRLAGYVRVADPAAFDAEAVTGHLAERLPEYMVPPVLVPLAQFPLSPNGKVDRKALLETGAPQAGGSGYVEPRTDTEKALAKIWADVLGVDRVGAHDNFFTLGGHSILSLKTLSQIKRAFGVRPTFRELLDTPTLAGFAELIEETLLRELEKAAAADAGAGDAADTERKA
ncbi:amino acid adenylation domain-containing protein [Kitasatospora sp. NPDC018619]|uniref:non-ribosomal peptide synthetase n=1 Tax=unclassified Kitasatospora TaxID=2633591 RepID=UPI0037AB0BB3